MRSGQGNLWNRCGVTHCPALLIGTAELGAFIMLCVGVSFDLVVCVPVAQWVGAEDGGLCTAAGQSWCLSAQSAGGEIAWFGGVLWWGTVFCIMQLVNELHCSCHGSHEYWGSQEIWDATPPPFSS